MRTCILQYPHHTSRHPYEQCVRCIHVCTHACMEVKMCVRACTYVRVYINALTSPTLCSLTYACRQTQSLTFAALYKPTLLSAFATRNLMSSPREHHTTPETPQCTSFISLICRREATSQTRTDLSWHQLTTHVSFGEKRIVIMAFSWPASLCA